MVNTSILPVREGTTVFGYPWAEYNTLQKILKSKGYSTVSTHPEVPEIGTGQRFIRRLKLMKYGMLISLIKVKS